MTHEEINKLCEEVNNLNGRDVLLFNGKLGQLKNEGISLKESEPEEAYRLLAIAAYKSLALPESFDEFKQALMQECSDLVFKHKGSDYFLDVKLAQLLKGKNEYLGAATCFVRAADAYAREGGLRRIIEDKPRMGDWATPHWFLREAMACYQLAGDSDASRRSYLRSMKLKLKNTQGLPKARLWASYVFWEWGESPGRVVLWGAVIVLLFAGGFWSLGIKSSDHVEKHDFWNSLYLSIITFTTVGYGDYQPATAGGKLLACAEGLLGIFFTGLFLVTFVKKFSR